MGLAPGAETFFYSIADLNPYNADNEGFLTWLYIVGNQVNIDIICSVSILLCLYI